MIQPVTSAMIAITRTAAADTSLINFICGCCCGQTISQSFSMAVLNSSAIQTRPVTINKISNCVGGSCIKKAAAITIAVAIA